MAARAEDPVTTRLASILKAYDKRELTDDSTESHQKWLASASGQADAAFLGEHYERLPEDRKRDVPTELARTGKDAVLPLLK